VAMVPVPKCLVLINKMYTISAQICSAYQRELVQADAAAAVPVAAAAVHPTPVDPAAAAVAVTAAAVGPAAAAVGPAAAAAAHAGRHHEKEPQL